MTNLLQKPPPQPNRACERPYSTLKPASDCSETPQLTFKVVLNSPQLDASSDHNSTTPNDQQIESPKPVLLPPTRQQAVKSYLLSGEEAHSGELITSFYASKSEADLIGRSKLV